MSTKFLKLILALVASLVLVISVAAPNASASSADNPLTLYQQQYQWSEPPITRPYTQVPGAWAAISFPTGLVGDKALMPFIVTGDDTKLEICQIVTADCVKSATRDIAGYFDLCSDSPLVACIDSVQYKLGDTWKDAQVIEKVDQTPDAAAQANFFKGISNLSSTIGELGWKAFPDLGLPASAKGPLVVSMPGLPNAAGRDTYVLASTFVYNGSARKLTSYDLSIRPVYVDTRFGNNMYKWIDQHADGTRGQSGSASFGVDLNDEQVSEASPKEIGWAAGFGESVPMRVVMRLPKSVGGWFQSRLDTPVMAVSSFDSATNLVTLEGSPIEVPVTEGAIDLKNAANQAATEQLFGAYTWNLGQERLKQTPDPGLVTWTVWGPLAGTESFTRWQKFIAEKAKATARVWTAGSIKSSSPCMSDSSSFQGLVNTNALTFQSDVPTYADGFLQYQVAGVHYDSNGKVFQGQYDFIMRKSVAQCLYGFTDAPISGTISVTSSDGAEQVAYTNVSEKNGWLQLSAKGFTFSSPTISAKLTQQSSASQESSSKATGNTPSSARKITIICLKGKTVKKVTAVSPKCPAGYKKK